MAALNKPWNLAVGSATDNNGDEFNRDTEVQVKLVTKPSREYIYDLLTKSRFPLTNLEAIIERRSNIVDFTCNNRGSAEKLVHLLQNHPNVKEARLFESEFVDVKFTGVPHRLPDGKLVGLLNKRNGEVISTRRLKDRRGYFDGRRIYKMRTAQLQQKPLPQFIRVCDCSIRVDYYGQPTRCFLCKKFGHIKSECPEAVEIPLLLPTDDRDDAVAVEPPTPNQQTTKSNTGSSEQPNKPREEAVQAPNLNDNSVIEDLICNGTEQNQQRVGDNASGREQLPHEETDEEAEFEQTHTSERPEIDNSEFSPSSSEAGEIPDDSIFTTDDESGVMGKKRQHSPDIANDKKQKPNVTGETLNCDCGSTIALPRAAGLSSLCICGRLYSKCVCENVVSSFREMPANCEKCRKPVARRHLDVTM